MTADRMARTPGPSRTRGLVEGALMAAIVSLLVAATYYIPGSGLVFSLAWPVPIALLYLRYDLRTAVSSVVVSTVLLALLIEPVNALDTAMLFGPLGLALGHGFRQRWPAGKTLALGAAAIAFATVGSITAFFVIAGLTPAQWLNVDIVPIINAFRQVEQLGTLRAGAADVVQTLLASLPWLLLVVTGAIALLIDYAAAVAIFRRLGYRVAPPLDFAALRLPAWLRFVAAAVLIGARFATGVPAPLRLLATGLALVLLALQGLAIAQFALGRLGANALLRAIVYIVTVIQPAAWWLLAIAGVADAVIDLRAKLPAPAAPEPGEKEVTRESHPHPRSQEPRQEGKRRRGR